MATIPEALALALQHHQAGRLSAAEQIYRQILAAVPDQADALHLLGVAAHQRGRHQEAADAIGRAIRCRPTDPAFHSNLGEVYRAMRQTDLAVDCFQHALRLKPDYPEAHNNLGTAWREKGRPDLAAECFRRALELRPGYVEAHNNQGALRQAEGLLDQAAECYEHALRLRPGYPQAHNNLGAVRLAQGRIDEAIECFGRALQSQPDYAEALNGLGNAWREKGQLDRAVECYRGALRHRPDHAAARTALVHQLQHACQWNELSSLAGQVVQAVDDPAPPDPVPPFAFLTLATPTTAAQQFRCARTWAERHLRSPGAQACPAGPKTSSKITLGYLSADFHAHATACLLSELIERHDRTRFAVHAYSYGPDDGSAMRQRLVAAFDRFVDVRDLSFTEAAQRIAQDGVDILIDLKGYTADARPEIAAQRPAPIQVNYLGYPGTMGAAFIDYILVDDFIVPADQQPHFSERLVHLPGCYQVNDSRREIAAHVPTRAEVGLPPEGFVFCSFNNSYKITPALFDVWMRLLKAVPGSVLWLLEGNRFAAQNLRREATARGVPAERLVFAPKLALPDHLARHRLADLFLDTFPVVAHTTASDALWAGCPLLTLAGETFVSRVAGSLLRALGLPELITTSLSDYEQTALRLAQDPEALAVLRQRLENQRDTSGLFDGARFARDIEQAYQRMWETRAGGVNLPSPACGRGAGGEGGRKAKR